MFAVVATVALGAATAQALEVHYATLVAPLDVRFVHCEGDDPYEEFPPDASCFLADAPADAVIDGIELVFAAIADDAGGAADASHPRWTHSWTFGDGLPRRPFALGDVVHMFMVVPRGAQSLIVIAPTF